MMKASTRLLVIMACAVMAPARTSATDREPAAPDVFILAGESNMSGRGAATDLSDAERTPDAAIRRYGNDGRWQDALDPLDDAAGQPQAGVGPGLFFARALRLETRRVIALVPCIRGDSPISDWSSGGGPDTLYPDTLYRACVARARATGGRLAGILWYQGETDAGKPRDFASAWYIGFARLIRAFRRDLAAPHLPVAFVQIADAPGPPDGSRRYPSWGLIQQQQARRPIGCTTMVSATGLPIEDDRLHLTTAAQRVLGAKLAGAIDTLIRRGCR